MSMKRIFLGTKRDLSIGAICDVTTKTAQAYKFEHTSDRKSTRLNSSHITRSRMPSSA